MDMSTCAYVGVCTCLWSLDVDVRSPLGLLSALWFETGLSLSPELTDWLDCLANSSRDSFTCLPAPCTRVTAACDHVQLLNGCWRSEFKVLQLTWQAP